METQPRSLNTLYKLLWEQIKDRNYIGNLTGITSQMEIYGLITRAEENIIDYNICALYSGVDNTQKEFVQRMIKETENDN